MIFKSVSWFSCFDCLCFEVYLRSVFLFVQSGVMKPRDTGVSERVYFNLHSAIVSAKSNKIKQLVLMHQCNLATPPISNGKELSPSKKKSGKKSTKAALLKGESKANGDRVNGGAKPEERLLKGDGMLVPSLTSIKLPTGMIRLDLDAKQIDFESMSILRKYWYSGIMSLSQETVFRILDACWLLEVPDGIDLCVEYLKQHSDIHNVLHMLLAGSRYKVTALEESALEFVDSNFESVCETKAWCELDPEMLQKIVGRDSLYVREEASVFQGLAHWAQHTVHNDSKTNRQAILEEIVAKPEYLRLANMSREELIHVSQSSVVSNSPVLRRVLYDEALSRVKKNDGQTPTQLRLRNYLANHLSCAGSGTRYPIYNIQTCERTLTGHDRAVCIVTVAGNNVISGSGDSTIRVWDANTWECLQVLKGHGNSVVALRVFNDKLISASPDKTICVWDMTTWTLDRRLSGHRSAVCALAVCANEKLASGSDDGQLKVWSCRTWTLERTIPAHSHVIWSLASCREYVISGSSDTTINVWDVNTWRLVVTLDQHRDEVQALAVSDDTVHLYSGSDDGVIRIWDTHSWQCLNKLEGHNRAVLSLAVYGPNLLVSGLGNGVVKIWNVDPLSSCVELAEHTSCVMAVAVYKGKVISASFDKTIKIWGP